MLNKSVLIGEGATLRCSFGTDTSKLIVLDHGMASINKKQATINDRVPMVNIMPFCSCTRPNPVVPVPCTPMIVMNWMNPNNNIKIKGVPMLLKQCQVPCTFGGMITIVKE